LRLSIYDITAPLVRTLLRRTKAARRSQFEQLTLAPDRVVFLGDSITEGGLWDEWFPSLSCVNRGIGGDTVGDVAGRLESALNRPRCVSLLIGTNDLSGLGPTRNVQRIAEQTRGLVESVRRASPDSVVLINSVMPRRRSMADAIEQLNTHYGQISDEAGATYVDLWPALADTSRALRREFTLDSLHLNGAGYRAWVEVLRPHLDALDAG
jgi:lysophospholipase L1-like esterase